MTKPISARTMTRQRIARRATPRKRRKRPPRRRKMAEPGAGAWWDESWNPAGGCWPKSPGCTNCYAPRVIYNYSRARRWWGNTVHANVIDVVNGIPVFNGKLSAQPLGHTSWDFPRRWAGAEHPLLGVGKPSLIFVLSLADLFTPGRPKSVIDLTCATLADQQAHLADPDQVGRPHGRLFRRIGPAHGAPLAAKNVAWFQRRGSAMVQRALGIHAPAGRRGLFTFVSIGPMLKPIALPSDFLRLGVRTWVIVSGEQGPLEECRDLHPDRARAVRAQCRTHDIPFFIKQMATLDDDPARPLDGLPAVPRRQFTR